MRAAVNLWPRLVDAVTKGSGAGKVAATRRAHIVKGITPAPGDRHGETGRRLQLIRANESAHNRLLRLEQTSEAEVQRVEDAFLEHARAAA